MKFAIIAVSMLVGSFASAATPNSYGPGAYTKTGVVCWGSQKEAKQCGVVTNKMYAPRAEKFSMKDGKNGNEVTFVRNVTGNYTSGTLSAEEILRNNRSKEPAAAPAAREHNCKK